jgi:hypothetical protein
VPARGDNSKTGTTAFPFLKVNVGARPVAMGGAFTGLADDESALHYNPAGITHFETPRYIFGYDSRFSDFGLQSGFIGYIRPFGYTKAFAIFVNYLNVGGMKEADEAGNLSGRLFGGGDLAFGATFALNHNDKYRFGVTGKFIYQSIHDYSATGIAFDFGVKYVTDRERYSAGLMIQNLGTQFSTLGGGEKFKLPLAVRVGGAARPKGLGVLLAADLVKPIDNDLYVAFGGEYFDLKPLYLRLGWNTFAPSNYRTGDSEDSWAGLSVGFGFEIADLGFLKNTHLSYSFSPAAELGSSHRITLSGGN